MGALGLGEWAVDVKGDRLSGSFEISVIKKSNEHGFLSYGWFGKDKLLVLGSGGPCSYKVESFVWECALRTAANLCDGLNFGVITPDL